MDVTELELSLWVGGVGAGAGLLFFLSKLRKIWLNRSSERTTNRDLICPFSSGLTRRRMVVISLVEKLLGSFFTAST